MTYIFFYGINLLILDAANEAFEFSRRFLQDVEPQPTDDTNINDGTGTKTDPENKTWCTLISTIQELKALKLSDS
jgi:hypothetical protein